MTDLPRPAHRYPGFRAHPIDPMYRLDRTTFMRHSRDDYVPVAAKPAPLNARRAIFIRWIAPLLALSALGFCIGMGVKAQPRPAPAAIDAFDGDGRMVFPRECSETALDAMRVPVEEFDRHADKSGSLYEPDGYVNVFKSPIIIYVRRGLAGWKRAEVIRHEKCHILWFYLYNTPQWHKAGLTNRPPSDRRGSGDPFHN